MTDAKETATVSTCQKNFQKNSTSQEVQDVLKDIINISIPLLVSVFGVISNTINICIFWKLGLKDSMCINTFALSLVDCLTTFLQAAVCLCYLVHRLYPASNVDVWALGFFAFLWMQNAVYMSSCWITALITIERCFCIVLPFDVKHIFNKSRSVGMVLIINVVLVGLHVPIYVIHKMEWVEITYTIIDGGNITETRIRVFTAVHDEYTARIERIFDIVVSLVLSDVSFVIVIVCTVWMIRGLKARTKIREPMTLKSAEVPSQSSNLSIKERKLVKVAMTLAITLSACGLPRLLVVSVQSSVLNYNISLVPWYITYIWAVAYIFTTLGSSLTIFVYLVLNSSYRAIFYQWF